MGAEDLSNYDLVGVWSAFAARESAIDLMHAPTRRGEGPYYARSMLVDAHRHDVQFAAPEVLRNRAREGYDRMPLEERMRSRLDIARRQSLLSDVPKLQFLRDVGYGTRYQKLNLFGEKKTNRTNRISATSTDFGCS